MHWLRHYFRQIRDIYADAEKREDALKDESLLHWNSMVAANALIVYVAPIPPLARWLERKLV